MPTPDPASRTVLVRQIAIACAKLLVSAALLWILLSRTDISTVWAHMRGASPAWVAMAIGLYWAMLIASAWRWGMLLDAQGVPVARGTLIRSYLVATFFNNFLPSNIGGDVIRIRDTAQAAGSKTLATTVVLVDRGIGLMGLGLVAALGATAAAGLSREGAVPVWPPILWVSLLLGTAVSAPMLLAPAGVQRALQPLRIFHQEWVGERISRVTSALSRFRDRPEALLGCFGGAVLVQAVLVLFYLSVARSMSIPISLANLAVIVPISFVIQMIPVSAGGYGVREATFSFYFARLGLPFDAALAVSLGGAGLVLMFSLSGAAVYLCRE
jgi:glycosyltransferase 2 family protein